MSAIYLCDSIKDVRYSLHTEPALPRSGAGYLPTTAKLKWCDEGWVETFAFHVFNVVDFLGVVPEMVELHPGYRSNTINDVAKGISKLLRPWTERYEKVPKFLLENRSGQIISRGPDLKRFWDECLSLGPEQHSRLGLIIDAQQLYTMARGSYVSDLAQIPPEAVWEYHIHSRHSVPGKRSRRF